MANVINFAISFPTMMVVCSFFWSVYFIDRELIYPVRIEPFYPQWANFIDHGLVFPIGVFNIMYQRFQMSRTVACFLAWTFGLMYTAWLKHIHNVTGKWVYPFMHNLEPYGGVEYLVVTPSLVLTPIVQYLGWKLNQMVHPIKYKQK